MPTPVDAIWLRTDFVPQSELTAADLDKDPGDRPQILRVLAKLPGEAGWRIAIEYHVLATGMNISHIAEAHALDRKPIDPLTASDGPTFNHSRADGPHDPCPICLRLMDREQLLALAKDLLDDRTHRSQRP